MEKEKEVKKRNATHLKPGESSLISRFSNAQISSQFLELGCLPNASIELVRLGPMGSTYYMKINNQPYAFRKEEAAQILLKY